MGDERIVLTDLRPELRDVGIAYFGHYTQKSVQGRLTPEHHDNCYEICFLENGAQPYYILPDASASLEEAQRYDLHGGEAFITYPFQFHSSGPYFQLRGSLYWIQLDAQCPRLLLQSPEYSDCLREALSSLRHHVYPIPPSVVPHLTEAFHLIHERADQRNLVRACCLLSLFVLELADIDAQLVEKPAGTGRALSRKGADATRFIQSNLLSPNLNLNAVARHLHYSNSYTSTWFKRETGLTVHEFIVRSKIEYACELLKKHPITDVAAALNFSSSQHFSKVFKEQMGLTPSEYAGLSRSKRAESPKE